MKSNRCVPSRKSAHFPIRLSTMLFAAWACAWILTSPARASGPGADDLAVDQMSVRELMRLDAEQALAQTRARVAGQNNSRAAQGVVSKAAHGGTAPRLVAIYGVGKKLLAEVLVGSQPHVYMRGQALPVGAKPGAAVPMLRGITGSCVQLERHDETHTLCLHPSLWAGG
ncbi:hypothetical protein [Paralcaligenes ureilyticus]|nr:hypothetical protein [Paralcaligenes ureilyticus]